MPYLRLRNLSVEFPVYQGGSQSLKKTLLAATTQGKPGGYAVPNDVVAAALSDSTGEVSTGACTG